MRLGFECSLAGDEAAEAEGLKTLLERHVSWLYTNVFGTAGDTTLSPAAYTLWQALSSAVKQFMFLFLLLHSGIRNYVLVIVYVFPIVVLYVHALSYIRLHCSYIFLYCVIL